MELAEFCEAILSAHPNTRSLLLWILLSTLHILQRPRLSSAPWGLAGIHSPIFKCCMGPCVLKGNSYPSTSFTGHLSCPSLPGSQLYTPTPQHLQLFLLIFKKNPFCAVLGVKPGALYMSGKCSTIELQLTLYPLLSDRVSCNPS